MKVAVDLDDFALLAVHGEGHGFGRTGGDFKVLGKVIDQSAIGGVGLIDLDCDGVGGKCDTWDANKLRTSGFRIQSNPAAGRIQFVSLEDQCKVHFTQC